MRQKLPLYTVLGIESGKMPDVWVLVKQYPPPELLRSWYPRVMPWIDVELLYARYHESGEVKATLREVGKQHGLAAERVRTRLNRIIGWLRDQLDQLDQMSVGESL